MRAIAHLEGLEKMWNSNPHQQDSMLAHHILVFVEVVAFLRELLNSNTYKKRRIHRI